MVKIHWRNLTKNLLQNHWANLNPTWYEASLGKWDANFKRSDPFSSWDNNEITKIMTIF